MRIPRGTVLFRWKPFAFSVWNGSKNGVVIEGLKKISRNRLGDYNQCCHLGKVSLPEIGQCPVETFDLLTRDNAWSIELRRNIIQINSFIVMALLKSTSPPDRNVGQGHWCFASQAVLMYRYTKPVFKTKGRTSTTTILHWSRRWSKSKTSFYSWCQGHQLLNFSWHTNSFRWHVETVKCLVQSLFL